MPHTELAYVINGPQVSLTVRVIKSVRTGSVEFGQSTTVYLWRRAAQWRRSGGAAAAQWRRSGGAAAAQWRRSGVVLLLVARLADSVVHEWQWQWQYESQSGPTYRASSPAPLPLSANSNNET
jgi:hypothetical protein